MANNTLRDDLMGDQVKLKRYFYALRPALACRWIVEKQTVPPMEFYQLRVLISHSEVQNSIDNLLEQKQMAYEKAFIAPVMLLNEWLMNTLNLCKEQVPLLPSDKKDSDKLNEVFRKYIQS